jgi:hypothetical protein
MGPNMAPPFFPVLQQQRLEIVCMIDGFQKREQKNDK